MTTRASADVDDETRPRPNSPGNGYLHLSGPSRATFSSLLATYPLKLLAPSPLPSQPPHIATAYTLAYGGGLVAGDFISLRVQVDAGCGLVMLTQGSTKVFKQRPGIRPISHSKHDQAGTTRQRLHVTLASGAFVLLLPDSVSPFRESRYSQAQRFVLPTDRTASILVLDWVNSGRGQRPPPRLDSAGSSSEDQSPEVWAMESYNSLNAILLGDRVIMRDRMLLDNTTNAVAPRMKPFNIYATILIYGPHLASLLTFLEELCTRTRQFQARRPPDPVWAFSPVEDAAGGVVRVAGVEVENVRRWVREMMEAGGMRDLVGAGLWPRLI